MLLHLALLLPLLPSTIAVLGVILWCASPTKRTVRGK
jgi:hypothetical protein